VDEEEIEILYSPLFKLKSGHSCDMLWRMEGVPELENSQVFAPGKKKKRKKESTLEVTNTSSRFTMPSLMARANPSPASCSFPMN